VLKSERGGNRASQSAGAAADDPWFEETLASASPDMLREMIRGFAQRMMNAEAGVRCGAGDGEVSPQRVNSRNGYRSAGAGTRAGATIELAIPKLRAGSYFPAFLEHRRTDQRQRRNSRWY